ncbi:MAG: DUF1761 domain-containing protein [Candidatus Nanoarchaeia archaeon]|nr:DUF1761 domain-containing protein [Candidatus Nanoarchaeia archaeon]
MISWNVNYLAVFVTAIISMAIGMFWYSQKALGTQWIELSKIKIDKKKMEGMGQKMFIAFIAALITSFVLANFIKFTEAANLVSGAQTGLLIWFGFIAPVQLGIVLWESKPIKLFLINTGCSLVNLAIIGAILAVWM